MIVIFQVMNQAIVIILKVILCNTKCFMCIFHFLEVSHSTLPGFFQDYNISVSYNGHKSSVDWKENGIQLQFEEDKSEDCSNTPIQISTGSLGYTRMPNEVKPVSKVYHVHNSRQLETAVTIRIKHDEPNDVQNLCFITCSEEKPPYDFTYLPGGTFTSSYGEMVVSRFSFYIISQLYSRYRVRGVLSLLEKSYEASLFVSSTPRIWTSEQHCWNIYVSLVKNCRIFRQCVSTYIKEEYEEDVKLVSRCITHFNHIDNTVSVCTQLSSSDVILDEPDCTYLHKTDISRYVDACPPLLKYRLCIKPGSSVTVKFILTGLRDVSKLTLRQYDLPGKKYRLAIKQVTLSIIIVR